jgi:hypothetical protein
MFSANDSIPLVQSVKETFGLLRETGNKGGSRQDAGLLFRDTMLKLIHSDSLEYRKLTKAA